MEQEREMQPARRHLEPTLLVGTGPIKVIVSHGWIADHSIFAPFIDLLDRARFTYAFIDCRGYGTRREELGPLTMAAAADDVLAVADHLGWNKFHVMGHSMGGMAAQRLMVDVPERLESAILVAPVPASGATFDDDRRAMLTRATQHADTRRMVINTNMGGLAEHTLIDRIFTLSIASTRAEAMQAYFSSFTTTDFAAEAVGSRVKVLAVAGGSDPGAHPQRMRETILAWYPNSEMAQMNKVGHYPMQENAEEFADAVDTFLTKISS